MFILFCATCEHQLEVDRIGRRQCINCIDLEAQEHVPMYMVFGDTKEELLEKVAIVRKDCEPTIEIDTKTMDLLELQDKMPWLLFVHDDDGNPK